MYFWCVHGGMWTPCPLILPSWSPPSKNRFWCRVAIFWFFLYIYYITASFVYFFLFVSGRTPFNISCKAGLVLINSTFVLGIPLFLLHIWMITFLNKVFLADTFYLSVFWECLSTPSWSVKFVLRNLLIVQQGFFCRFPSLFFLWLLLQFSLLWILTVFNIMCLEENLYLFNQLSVFLASWTCIFISFPRFGKFSTIIYLNKLSVPFSLSSYSGLPITMMLPFLKR